jgi:hypothetical protein
MYNYGFWVGILLHTHTAANSTWSHAEPLEENALPTPKQTPNRNAYAKNNCASNNRVASRKMPYPHKKKQLVNR